MRHILKLSLVVVGATLLLNACRSATEPQGGTTAADPAFSAAVPSYSTASVEMESADSSAPSSDLVATDSVGTQLAGSDSCHPHLFVRTHEVVARLNLHSAILLNDIKEVVAENPTTKTADSHIWQMTRNSVIHKLTLTKESSGLTYDFTLQLAAVPTSGDPTFVAVASGSTTSNGGTPNEETGSMTFDFDARKSVIASETATGQFTVDFDVVKSTSKKLVFRFTHFLPRGGDPHGPRTGSFVHYGKTGVGGSLKYQDTVVLLCPSNASALPANLDTVGEWYIASDSTLHGRADALAIGGQITVGDQWEGVTCSEGATISDASEGYWMMKVEDANGATIGGSSVASAQAGPATCDAAFINGSSVAPSLNDNSTDFPFATSFNADGTLKDETPFLFPAIQ